MLKKAHHTPHGFTNNYVGSVTRGFRDLLRWQFTRIRRRLPPPPTLPIPEVSAELAFLHENASAGERMMPSVTWIGHASAMVQASGVSVLTDPVFSERVSPFTFAGPKRAQRPGIAVQDLPHIDVVVISHNHYDHLDRTSVVALSRQAGGCPLFLVPLGLMAWLAKLGITHARELDWWDEHVHAGVAFHLTPAQHWSGRSLSDRNRTLWGGWAVFGADFHWFFTGDTGYSRDFADIRQRFSARQSAELGGGFDIALIAVGACLPRWFMHLQHVDLGEAVQLHVDLGAKRSVGVHWGTFALADDALDLPIHGLGDALAAKGVSDQAFFLLPIGGTRRLERRSMP